jgi:hypothetical protein
MSTLFKTVGAVLCLVLGLCFATPVKADSLYTPTFTCTAALGFCASLPTATDVSFPAPTTIDVTVFNELLVVPLPAGDLPTDMYSWGEVGFIPAFPPNIVIVDVTNGNFAGSDGSTGTGGTAIDCGGSDDTGCGTLSFTPVATPEPSSLALLLAGIGLAMRKRKGLSQAS